MVAGNRLSHNLTNKFIQKINFPGIPYLSQARRSCIRRPMKNAVGSGQNNPRQHHGQNPGAPVLHKSGTCGVEGLTCSIVMFVAVGAEACIFASSTTG